MRVRQTLSANECEAVVVKRVRKLWLKESGQRTGAGTPTLNLLRLVINLLHLCKVAVKIITIVVTIVMNSCCNCWNNLIAYRLYSDLIMYKNYFIKPLVH